MSLKLRTIQQCLRPPSLEMEPLSADRKAYGWNFPTFCTWEGQSWLTRADPPDGPLWSAESLRSWPCIMDNLRVSSAA